MLLWGIGNEMEGFKAGDDPAIWKAVDDIAAMAKKLDPNHPTMTVVAELGGARVKSIHELCPHIDIVGINSYGGVAEHRRALPQGRRHEAVHRDRVRAARVRGSARRTVGAFRSSRRAREKARVLPRRRTRRACCRARRTCASARTCSSGATSRRRRRRGSACSCRTGRSSRPVHTMAELWSGNAPANRCPQDRRAEGGSRAGRAGQTLRASVDVSDPDGDPMALKWVLTGEVKKPSVGGGKEDPAAEVRRCDRRRQRRPPGAGEDAAASRAPTASSSTPATERATARWPTRSWRVSAEAARP